MRHTVKLTMEDNIYQNIMFLLSNLNVQGLKIEEEYDMDDLSHLEPEIDKGLASGISDKSHSDIVNNIKRKYA